MRCPFCNIQDESCEHLLLTVDTTFREAQNGALYEWFSDAWDAVWEREGDDFDEYIEFEELLDVVDFYADADADSGVASSVGLLAAISKLLRSSLFSLSLSLRKASFSRF